MIFDTGNAVAPLCFRKLGFGLDQKSSIANAILMRIISWNINGISRHFEDLKTLVATHRPDVVCLQKVKCSDGIGHFPIEGYSAFDLETYRSRYYGVATYLRNDDWGICNFPDNLAREGHFQALLHKGFSDRLTLLNCYVPYSNPAGNFVAERKAWDIQLRYFVDKSANPGYFILCGDFNVVNESPDTWDGRERKNIPCFLDWERQNFHRLLQCGDLVDAYRALHPQANEYSYFNRLTDRANNKGYRIDYFLVSRSLMQNVRNCEIIDFISSDSNPILLDIDI